jgi:hypothetical protein
MLEGCSAEDSPTPKVATRLPTGVHRHSRQLPTSSAWANRSPFALFFAHLNTHSIMPLPTTMKAVVMERRGEAIDALVVHTDWPLPVRKPNQVRSRLSPALGGPAVPAPPAPTLHCSPTLFLPSRC